MLHHSTKFEVFLCPCEVSTPELKVIHFSPIAELKILMKFLFENKWTNAKRRILMVEFSHRATFWSTSAFDDRTKILRAYRSLLGPNEGPSVMSVTGSFSKDFSDLRNCFGTFILICSSPHRFVRQVWCLGIKDVLCKENTAYNKISLCLVAEPPKPIKCWKRFLTVSQPVHFVTAYLLGNGGGESIDHHIQVWHWHRSAKLIDPTMIFTGIFFALEWH